MTGDAEGHNTDGNEAPRTVTASRRVQAPASLVFELIADPAQQPRWDGNANLAEAPGGQRVRAVGDVFTMTLTRGGGVRENHVVEFEESRLLAWMPSEVGKPRPGHLWRWQLRPQPDGTTVVTHTYDWSNLTDVNRVERARATT
ncbi:MAG: polyketide cyclase, partial [Micrococcales bacterium]